MWGLPSQFAQRFKATEVATWLYGLSALGGVSHWSGIIHSVYLLSWFSPSLSWVYKSIHHIFVSGKEWKTLINNNEFSRNAFMLLTQILWVLNRRDAQMKRNGVAWYLYTLASFHDIEIYSIVSGQILNHNYLLLLSLPCRVLPLVPLDWPYNNSITVFTSTQ